MHLYQSPPLPTNTSLFEFAGFPIKSAGWQDVVKSRNHKTCATPRSARSLPDSQPATKDLQALLLPLTPTTTACSAEPADHSDLLRDGDKLPDLWSMDDDKLPDLWSMDDDLWSMDERDKLSDLWSMDERLPLFHQSAWLQEDEEGTRSQLDTPCDKELAERSLPVTDNQPTLDGCPARPGSSSMDDASPGNHDEAPNSMMAVPEQVPVHQCLNLLRHSEQRFRNIARLLYAAKLLEDGLKINKEGGSWKVCLKKKEATSNKSGDSVLFIKGECVVTTRV